MSKLAPLNPELQELMYRRFRAFFAKAEAKRRWSLEKDIPWDKVNPNIDPSVAVIVESFCAVELYLPDYVAKALPMIRQNRGWAWFHINWGYEESKHSLALSDWLVRSGLRTEEQRADLERQVFSHEWNLPEESPSGMVIYAMAQELATWVSYKRLREHVAREGDPALECLLKLVAVDECSHYAYYTELVKVFLELDRATTLEQLRHVLHSFAMPAVYDLADSQQRQAKIRSLNIFDEEIFFSQVYYPILNELGVTRKELRGGPSKKGAA